MTKSLVFAFVLLGVNQSLYATSFSLISLPELVYSSQLIVEGKIEDGPHFETLARENVVEISVDKVIYGSQEIRSVYVRQASRVEGGNVFKAGDSGIWFLTIPRPWDPEFTKVDRLKDGTVKVWQSSYIPPYAGKKANRAQPDFAYITDAERYSNLAFTAMHPKRFWRAGSNSKTEGAFGPTKSERESLNGLVKERIRSDLKRLDRLRAMARDNLHAVEENNNK